MATDEPLAEARERQDHQSIRIAEGYARLAAEELGSTVARRDEPVAIAPPEKEKRLESAL
jgi:hypothetical protein